MSSLGKDFSYFLSQRFYIDISQATPYRVQMFLIYKDKKGKTKVHDIHCKNLGKMSDTVECSCPKRLAFGTVQSLIGQLKTIFEELRLGKFGI